MPTHPPNSTLFPYTTLFRSLSCAQTSGKGKESNTKPMASSRSTTYNSQSPNQVQATIVDRKSTRLNSSHLVISYAVFCLKKKRNRNGQLNNRNTNTTVQTTT